MKRSRPVSGHVMGASSRASSLKRIAAARHSGARIVFTNGCYDLIHAGHVRFLKQAKSHGGFLVVGINSDASVRRLKGAGRPILPAAERILLLESLKPVDCVIAFSEDTPYNLIRAVQPDVLIKGGDWSKGNIIGSDVVEARGGKVISGLFVKGRSTSAIIDRIHGLKVGVKIGPKGRLKKIRSKS